MNAIEKRAHRFLVRQQVLIEKQSDMLDGYLIDRLQLFKEDTDVALRQLETHTPVINRYRSEQKQLAHYKRPG